MDDRLALALIAVLAAVLVVLTVWVGRLEARLKEAGKAGATPAGQREASAELETTLGEGRPTSEKKLLGAPKSLASQAAIRNRAEQILRERARQRRLSQQGGAA